MRSRGRSKNCLVPNPWRRSTSRLWKRRCGALQLAAHLLEQQFNRDHSDYQGSSLPCACGRRARYVERRWKSFHSVVGKLKLERAYYCCWGCERGFCPRDRTLGMDATSLSPAVVRMIGTVRAMVSFEEGSDLLTELAGVAVDAKQVERTAEGLGKEIAEDERVHTEPLDALPLPRTLHLGMDGTGIPLRAEELVGRTGKQPDGSAKTGEVKLCTIWSAESLDEQGTPVRDEGSVTYSAALARECFRAGHRRRTLSLRPACLAGGHAPALLPSATPGRARGRGRLDLEHRRRSVFGCHADRRPLSRQATLERSRKSSLRSHQPTNCSVGRTPERRTR